LGLFLSPGTFSTSERERGWLANIPPLPPACKTGILKGDLHKKWIIEAQFDKGSGEKVQTMHPNYYVNNLKRR
jgi:hypothetical protein